VVVAVRRLAPRTFWTGATFIRQMVFLTAFGRRPGRREPCEGDEMTPHSVSARKLEGKGRDLFEASRSPPSDRQAAGEPMTEIKTRQLRRVHSPRVGDILIEHTYLDSPASLETWVDHCAALAAEFGISPLEVHRALFVQLPEIFGR
jgi:hypothetical protein